MIHSTNFTAVLDTNVIIPLTTRDILFWFAHYDLFTPKWSKHIFDEWIHLMEGRQIDQDEIRKRVNTANMAFPDALVRNYETLIETIDLPDTNDRHVLAAAIKTNADLIVTNNLKDFPEDYLDSFGLYAKSADDFLIDTIDLNQEIALLAFRKMVLNRKSPDMDEYEVLDLLRKSQLEKTANYLHAQL